MMSEISYPIKSNGRGPRIAYFVSPHGFGHAARVCAVSAALHQHCQNIEINFFTTVPEWFFNESLDFPFQYTSLVSDVGVAQVDALNEDLPETIRRLEQYFPLNGERIDSLAQILHKRKFDVVLCDIAPLGLAAAQAANIPAMLIENFTWDWIYSGYLEAEPRFADFMQPLQAAFTSADVHIQTIPYCEEVAGCTQVQPVARKPKHSRSDIRTQLSVSEETPLILLTMGGVRQVFSAIEQLKSASGFRFVIPGAADEPFFEDNLILLPHHSAFYHPDLVYASDAVVGKLGYSTVAEAFHANIPYGYIPRYLFRETGPMSCFVEDRMGGMRISSADFSSGAWVRDLPALLNQIPLHSCEENGADQIARLVLKL